MKKRLLRELSGVCMMLLALPFAAAAVSVRAPDGVLGVEVIEEPLPFYDGSAVRDPMPGDRLAPMRALLTRERYWSQDGHMGVVVQLNPAAARGGVEGTLLEVAIYDSAGGELASFAMEPPGERFIFYPVLPPGLLGGGRGEVELRWTLPTGAGVSSRHGFRVEQHPGTVPESGAVSIRIHNEEGVVERGVPFTVGVPFPRGALYDTANLRLVSVDGWRRREIPLQAVEAARWSKYGSLRWVHADFTVDLAGEDRELELEYGPRVRRRRDRDIAVGAGEVFPAVSAGRLRFEDGVWFDAAGDGGYVKVIDGEGLRGAFVEHEDGRVYRMGGEGGYELEESGPRKVVLKREGWYVEEGSGEEFCKHITRYIIHRDSPLLRIFHSWIFTGDGNRDRIRNMGWEFRMAEGFEGAGFLSSYGEDGRWLEGDYLLQWDYEHYDVVSGADKETFAGGSAAGAAAAEDNGVRFYLGARDFWQNYPSELEFSGSSLMFYNWPRHNRPAGYTFEGELITRAGEPALPSAARHAHYSEGRLTRSEWKLNVIQARFAHEGELLDFRLPDELAEDPIWSRATNSGGEIYWEKGKPETANAQGISRTEEFWLYFTSSEPEPSGGAGLLRGLDYETLRAVVDPEWTAASGAFYEMHRRDVENYPEEERVFELIAKAPERVTEQLGVYGMWIYGGLPAYNPALARREPGLYRAYRKRHQGWPYRWEPFARSGDPELLRLADASTRQMIDAAYCHYYTDELDMASRPMKWRRTGIWQRSTIPWTAHRGPEIRGFSTTCDHLWHAWYLRGYHRAKDNALDWAEGTKDEHRPGSRRIRSNPPHRDNINLLQAYVHMHEATHDAWFIVAAHAIAEGHMHAYSAWSGEDIGHFWRAGSRDYLRFTGCEDYRGFYLAYADTWGRHNKRTSWMQYGCPSIEANAFAWHLTGDEYYLRRVAADIDWASAFVVEADDYRRGQIVTTGMTRYHAWYMQYFPIGLGAFEAAGVKPEPAHGSFVQGFKKMEGEGSRYESPAVHVRKEEGRELPLSLSGHTWRWKAPALKLDYRVKGPDGEAVLSGSFMLRDSHHAVIPAGAPAGVYRLQVEGDFGGLSSRDLRSVGLEVPVSPAGTPEVMVWEKPGVVLDSPTVYNPFMRYWFFVPEGAEGFFLDTSWARRVSVWEPGGERVWDSQGVSIPARAQVDVKPAQSGRLWRITVPGGGALTLDARIPPVLAVSPERWFMPETP